MIKGIGESLSQLRQSQTVTSHYVAPISGAPRSAPKARPIPKHRLEAYGRWAKVTQEQHNISASQVVLQSLSSAKSILGQLNKQLQTCLFSKSSVVEDALHKAEECRRQLIEIKPHYQGKRLLDHHLNLISASQPAALHFLSSDELISPHLRTAMSGLRFLLKSKHCICSCLRIKIA
ncbi:hypothetical protein P4S54_23080 [Shewanella sp. PP-He15 brown]